MKVTVTEKSELDEYTEAIQGNVNDIYNVL